MNKETQELINITRELINDYHTAVEQLKTTDVPEKVKKEDEAR